MDVRAQLERWFLEIWQNGNFAVADEVLDPECLMHGFPTPEATMERDVLLAYIRNFRSIFTDIRIVIDDLIVDGDRVAARTTALMRHTGPGLGMEATNEAVRIEGGIFYQLRNGRILRAWNYYDIAGEVARIAQISREQATQAAEAAQRVAAVQG